MSHLLVICNVLIVRTYVDEYIAQIAIPDIVIQIKDTLVIIPTKSKLTKDTGKLIAVQCNIYIIY